MDKTLKLLMLLANKRKYSLKEITDRFEISDRTAYRYLNHIEENGFIIERENGTYRLASDHNEYKTLSKIFHFTEPEIAILSDALSEFKLSSPEVKSLIKKLHAIYDLQALSRLKKDGNIKNIQNLSTAISNKERVILKNYRSSHSGTESDREVEAFEFMPDYEAVWCFDLCDKTIKQFKIKRIEEVILSSIPWNYEHLHLLPFTDAFRMSANAPIGNVQARLTLKAYNLLIEEFPLSKSHVSSHSSHYDLDIPIADFHGIGRFVLGLPGEIQIKSPKEFQLFLKSMKKKSFD